MQQLNNPRHYIKLGYAPLFPSNQKEIWEILDKLESLNYITTKQLEFLKFPKDPRPRFLYLLPKIHKPPQKWSIPHQVPPGRPIISDVKSESYNVSAYINSFLQPLASNYPSYVQDSYDFVKMIHNLNIPLGPFW